ncbi:hypothetical protein [Roseicella aerolata]|uniref:Uncharacterized protein n=1 Tax=Roseicella aerolata TaxID=2883479 RepID=A0A9X1IJV2_9PROT|nr:hypothetical protein [Roseicella aerolata]MCB4825494.1 hypothetical protein [Roseicella aerolata]
MSPRLSSRALPWVIVDRTGGETVCETRADWIAEWRRWLALMERADRPAQQRREGLERALAANAGAFRGLVEHGALDAVLEVTGAAAAADARLSWLDAEAEAA